MYDLAIGKRIYNRGIPLYVRIGEDYSMLYCQFSPAQQWGNVCLRIYEDNKVAFLTCVILFAGKLIVSSSFFNKNRNFDKQLSEKSTLRTSLSRLRTFMILCIYNIHAVDLYFYKGVSFSNKIDEFLS